MMIRLISVSALLALMGAVACVADRSITYEVVRATIAYEPDLQESVSTNPSAPEHARPIARSPYAPVAAPGDELIITATAEPAATASPRLTVAPNLVETPKPVAEVESAETSEAEPTRQPAPQLNVIVPPCIRMPNSPADPCGRRDRWPHHNPNVSSSVELPDLFPTLRENILIRDAPMLMPHFIVRATVIPRSIRCGNSDFRLFITSSYETTFPESPSIGQPYCFIDIAVNEYLVGSGPNRLTVNTKVRAYGLTSDEPECDAACLANGADQLRATDIEGVEWVFALGGPTDLGVLAWDIVYRWDLQERGDGEVVVVEYWKHYMLLHSSQENYATNFSRLEHTLDDFRTIVRDAHRDLTKTTSGRITSASDLRGNPAALLASDAGPGGLRDFVFSTTAIERLDAKPTSPPPVPGENEPNPDGLTVNDIIATRVAGGVAIPGGLEGTATPVSALGDEPTATATVEPTATEEAGPPATPTVVPTATPQAAPTPEPEDTPTPEAELAPTATPEAAPTPEPEHTATATPEPIVDPTETPTPDPEPTATDTPEPVVEPTATATPEPAIEPTATPEDGVATDTPEPEMPAPDGPGAVGGPDGTDTGTGPDG